MTLVEMLVAVSLLSMIALALTTTIVACQRARAVSERWMRAVSLAVEGVEQLRAGHSLTALPGELARFSRAGIVQAAEFPTLLRAQVSVSWNDGQSHTLHLSTLVYRPLPAAAAAP
jgi:type II secretory pathway pseudopilin PulG